MRHFPLLAILLLVPAWVQAQSSQLEIKVSNISDARGSLKIALYNDGQHWLDTKTEQSPFRVASLPVTDTGNASIVLEDVPAGTYAVSVFHDLDGDGKLDTNFVGFPKEPYGFSGEPGRFGPPDFEKASFELLQEADSIEVPLN